MPNIASHTYPTVNLKGFHLNNKFLQYPNNKVLMSLDNMFTAL